MGSRNAGDGESVRLGASERDRVLEAERDTPRAPLCRPWTVGVGVRSRLLCSSTRVKEDAALEGGAETPMAAIVLRRSTVEEDAGIRSGHEGETATEYLKEWHFWATRESDKVPDAF